MPNIKHILLYTAVGITVILVLGYIITHSLWFLSQFVPRDSNILWAQKGNYPLIELLNSHAGLTGINLGQEGINSQDFGHLVLAKTGNSTQLVGRSKSIFQAARIQQDLQQQGWQVQAIGSFISAQTGATTDVLTGKVLLSRSWHGILQLINHVKEGINPIGIIHIGKNSIPLADTTYDATITTERQAIKVRIKHPHSQTAPNIPPAKNDPAAVNMGLQFALPGKMLSHIPSNLQSSSLAKVLGDLHITRKQTDLTKIIKEATYIAGTSNQQGSAVAIQANKGNLGSTLQGIVVAEEGYYHPKRHAFRLPDGSIGFELRPSTPPTVWSQVNESCGYYSGQEHQWWVCSNDTIGSIGTNQEVAQKLLVNYDPNIWIVIVGKDIVPENLQPAIQSIKVTGTSEETSIIIQ